MRSVMEAFTWYPGVISHPGGAVWPRKRDLGSEGERESGEVQGHFELVDRQFPGRAF